LVRELRLAGAATLAEGNALLPAFIIDYNGRFAKAPANNKDLHRPLRAGDDLDDAFAWKRGAHPLPGADFAIRQSDLHSGAVRTGQSGDRQTGHRRRLPDGRLAIRYNGVELAYRTFDKVRQVHQGAIADNKRLGPILAMIRDEQLRCGSERRSGPRRRDQRDTRLFKVG
jgi:hypothetical protein